MTKNILQLVVVLLIAAQGVMGQTVQVVDLPNAVPGDILVEVDMDGYTDVSAITLYIEFDSDLLDFTGITNTTLTGTWIANYNSSIDKAVVTYTAAPGYSNSPSGKLLDLQFYNKGGFSSDITFDEPNCEIVEFLTPISTTYTDGTITQGTSVGTVSMDTYVDAEQGVSLVMPVTMEGAGFGSVDAFTLKVSYDEASLLFTGLDNNILSGVTTSADNGVVTINWSSITPDDFTTLTTLFNLQFTYNGVNSTVLYFVPGCEISSSGVPLAATYENGLVTPLDAGYTFTFGTVGASSDSTKVTVPVVASGFTGITNVGALTLEISYHDSLTFTGYTAVQGSGWVMSGNSNNVLSFTMTVSGGFDLEDGNLLTLDFIYDYDGGGVADISFNPGCEMLASASLWIVPMIYNAGSVSNLAVTFAVEDGGGAPITDAIITFDGITYAAGVYTFGNLGNGTYAYSVAKTGYKTTSGSITFSGTGITETVVLYGFTVTFDVDDSGATDITDAIVTFNSTTNAAGDYVFTDVIDGTYAYSVSRTGYETTSGNAVVNGADLTVDVTLPDLYTMTGQLTYMGDVVRPIGTAGSSTTTVYLKNAADSTIAFTSSTDASGNYSFSDVAAGNYFLDAATDIDAQFSYDLTDVFVIFGIGNTLTGLQALAADVNEIDGVDITDAFIVYGSVIAGNVKVVAWVAPDWIFETPAISVSGNLIEDFSGICSGDANGDFVPVP
jgi:hypothetical protein